MRKITKVVYNCEDSLAEQNMYHKLEFATALKNPIGFLSWEPV